MTLSPQFLDELRARTLLSGVIAPSVKLLRAGREWKACCPFHQEKTPSFTINDEKGFYHCFGCGAHGDAIRFLTEARGLPFMDAVKELAGKAGLDIPVADPRAQERAARQTGLTDVMAAAQRWFADMLASAEGADARAYLSKRGIDAAATTRFGLGFAPNARNRLKAALNSFGEDALVDTGMLIRPEEGGKETYDRFRGRLMIPIRDARGRVIAFGGRILGEGEPKYLNSPETALFDKGRTLYNIDRASPASRTAKRLIVVEGYMDVIALDRAGIGEAVAPNGTAVTEAQLERMWRLDPAPILCFDGDSAGQKAAIRAARRALPKLGNEQTLQFALLPAGSDPDDFLRLEGANAFERVLAQAQPLSRLLYASAKDVSDVATPEGRAGLRQNLLDLADSIEHGILRSEYRRDFNDKFFQDFGWKRDERRVIGTSVIRTGPNSPREVYASIQRSALYGLARFPLVLAEMAEQVAFLSLQNDDLLRWREKMLDAVQRRPGLEDDALQAILEASKLKPKTRYDIQSDLRFRWDVDPSSAVRSLGGLVLFLHGEQDLVREMQLLERRMSDDLDHDQYLALDRERAALYARKQELAESAYRLTRDDSELE